MRRASSVLTALVLAGQLAACGFQPLYAPAPGGGTGSPVGPVTLSMVEGKAGHVLRTELSRMLRVGAGEGPANTLDIRLEEQVAGLGLRVDESATRADLTLIGFYTLRAPNGDVLVDGRLDTVVSYAIPTSAFGEIAAQDDARERAATVLAQRIRADLALRMAERRR